MWRVPWTLTLSLSSLIFTFVYKPFTKLLFFHPTASPSNVTVKYCVVTPFPIRQGGWKRCQVCSVGQFRHEPIIWLLFNPMDRAWINRRHFPANRRPYIFLSSHFTALPFLVRFPLQPGCALSCRMQTIQFEVAFESGSSSRDVLRSFEEFDRGSSFGCLKSSVRKSKFRCEIRQRRDTKRRNCLETFVVEDTPEDSRAEVSN